MAVETSVAQTATARPADYLELLKPRVMSLVVFTGFAGLVVAPGDLHPLLVAVTVLCIASGAGAAGALNMWYDRDIDSKFATFFAGSPKTNQTAMTTATNHIIMATTSLTPSAPNGQALEIASLFPHRHLRGAAAHPLVIFGPAQWLLSVLGEARDRHFA